jgi:hypothetical protein
MQAIPLHSMPMDMPMEKKCFFTNQGGTTVKFGIWKHKIRNYSSLSFTAQGFFYLYSKNIIIEVKKNENL